MEVKPKAMERNKLILLMILKEFDFYVSENQLLELVLDRSYMDYFDLRNSLVSMEKNTLIASREAINGMFYRITEDGDFTYDAFKKRLPYSLRESFQAFSKENRDRYYFESKLFAEYIQVGEEQFRISLKIMEDFFPVFEMNFIVNSKEEADIMKRAWLKKARRIYEKAFHAFAEE